jgi:2-amino-4-hydroxy-6-hydroxymethyldihydropteridine diphosphokinase
MRPARAYIGIGGNLDDPLRQMRRAFQALRELPASRCVACSPLYRSAPVGGPSGQPDYLNAAAALDTTLAPDELLTALQAIETAQGRNSDRALGAAHPGSGSIAVRSTRA